MTAIFAQIVWIGFPDARPPELPPGQYERYLVATDKHVFECSWLFGGWHTRHDGCSEVTSSVRYWAKLPANPLTTKQVVSEPSGG